MQFHHLALGTSGVRAIEMVNAYSILANGGKKVEPIFIKRVENQKGEVIFDHTKKDGTDSGCGIKPL